MVTKEEIIKEIKQMMKIEEENLDHIKRLLKYQSRLHSETVKQLKIEECSLNKRIDMLKEIIYRIENIE